MFERRDRANVDVGHPGIYFKGNSEPTTNLTGQPTTAWTELSFHANTTRTPVYSASMQRPLNATSAPEGDAPGP